ncbi:MAG TPA: NAD(P)H-dependent oxidoreductase [Pirellulales bacterium]|jgi:NAD(P)H-dependent FMN reductase|nr:NAD(P)H-dependent oxidoreductase [Pirellulales bacterium]
MAGSAKILAFAGSTRAASFNKKLVRIAADEAREAGADVTLIDLRDYPLPLFDGDLEANDGLPTNARALKDIFLAHNGLMISAPEYNSSITAVLKNTIDWVSRPVPNEASLACFANKLAVLMSASPGALGGLRGLVHVRAILGNIGVWVLPDQVAVMKAHESFQPDGTLKDAKLQASVKNLGAKLASALKKMNA